MSKANLSLGREGQVFKFLLVRESSDTVLLQLTLVFF